MTLEDDNNLDRVINLTEITGFDITKQSFDETSKFSLSKIQKTIVEDKIKYKLVENNVEVIVDYNKINNKQSNYFNVDSKNKIHKANNFTNFLNLKVCMILML